MRPGCRSTSRVSIAVTALVFVLLPAPRSAFAQDDSPVAFASPLRAGARALQFQVSQDFTLSSFQGSTLSYKTHRSARSAIRFGVSLSGAGTDSDVNRSYVRQDTLRSDQVGPSEDNEVSVALAVQVLRYRASASRVVPFLGVGPGASFSRDHIESRLDVDSPQEGSGGGEHVAERTDRTSRETKTWILGAAGVEWLAGRQLSLHAEYGFRLGYRWRHSSVASSRQGHPTSLNSYSKESSNANGWFLGDGSVLFGVSAYF